MELDNFSVLDCEDAERPKALEEVVLVLAITSSTVYIIILVDDEVVVAVLYEDVVPEDLVILEVTNKLDDTAVKKLDEVCKLSGDSGVADDDDGMLIDEETLEVEGDISEVVGMLAEDEALPVARKLPEDKILLDCGVLLPVIPDDGVIEELKRLVEVGMAELNEELDDIVDDRIDVVLDEDTVVVDEVVF
ncbi:MAG: hypothetical protein M1836_001173 [Candelina mexicana]|nr:MAG: hypothetical protein M1836_001173 [Candelina mexicana]